MKLIHGLLLASLVTVSNMTETSAAALPPSSTIKVQGRNLIVNNSTFTVKGVCYSPVKAGYTNANFDWWSDQNACKSDFPLIAAMGANCIRTYSPSAADSYVQAVLDAAARHGLYVILGYSVPWNQDFSVAANRTPVVNGFTDFVNKWKAHPAVLMWCFGNEIDVHTASAAGWFTLLDQASAAAHAAEGAGYHPVTTANQEMDEVAVYDSSVPNLDVWGLNLYRGKTFGAIFSVYSSTKPFMITEWGCDSFDGRVGNANETLQSEYIAGQWEDINGHLSHKNPAECCIGGCLFEWCDEWWKGASSPGDLSTLGGGGVKGPAVQDTAADWTNDNYADPNMNEEWWGIVAIELDSYTRKPKEAYYALGRLWEGSTDASGDAGGSAAGIIQGEVRNYPNPFIADGNNSTRIKFAVSGAPELNIEIFDLSGAKVRELSGINSAGSLREAYWDGKDSDSGVVPSGLYICKVSAALSGREEIKYRKIAAVK
ncbi:MAG: glycoside hydrolase family 2 TIM barrel-domain containing protein [Elusimicrobiota bacterium]